MLILPSYPIQINWRNITQTLQQLYVYETFITLQFRFVKSSCFLQFCRVPSPVGKDHTVSVVKCSVDSTKTKQEQLNFRSVKMQL